MKLLYRARRQGTIRLFVRMLFTILIPGLVLLSSACTSTRIIDEADIEQLPDRTQKEANDDLSQEDANRIKEEHVAAGDEAWNTGDPEKALFEYFKALELDNNDKFIYFKMGIVHEYLGNFNPAALAFARCTAIDPTYVPALERQGTMLLKQRKYAEARTAFERSIELDRQRIQSEANEIEPNDVAPIKPGAENDVDSLKMTFDNQSPFYAYNGLGIIEDLEGNHHKAFETFHIARTIMPQSAFVYNNMGYSSYLAGDLEAAEFLFGKAVSIDPDYAIAWRNLALLYVKRAQYDKAIETLSFRFEDEASAYNTVGYLCMLDRKYNKAEIYLKKAIDLSPTYFKAANENLKRNSELAAKKHYGGSSGK